ncbi:MAG: Abi family protein [Cyanobacteria bacterium P01_G01_bin.39]
MQHQYPYTSSQIASLEKSISPARISTYQRISGGNKVKALELYYWNMALGQSLYVSLQTLEVSLRNAIAEAIEHIFGQTWYAQARFKTILSSWSRTALESTVRKVTANNKRRGKPVSAGDIVANLTFSFWRELLKQRYDVHLWNSQLKIAFPNLPVRRDNQDIYNRVNKIISLRNRIAHHEPIIASKLTSLYNSMLEIIGWICLDTRDWVDHHCDFMTVHGNRP